MTIAIRMPGQTATSGGALEGRAGERPVFSSWIRQKRAAAVARGGRPLRNLPGTDDYDDFPRATARQRGEIINPMTGEVVTGCLTISKLSIQLGLSAQETAKLMEKAGCVARVLRTDEVPMICDPTQTKPRYYHTPEVTYFGMMEGLAVQIIVRHHGKRKPCILITPHGQETMRALMADRGQIAKPDDGKVALKRRLIGELLAARHSQAAIARATGLPKQTVSRIAKTIQAKEEVVPF
jgi:DNA invertase Pin-like site-specific DNA recombinase